MIVARGLGRGAQGQMLVTAGLGLDSAAVTPPQPHPGALRGFLPEKRKRRDRDDDLLILIL